jgi:hypothetical protein
MMHLLLSTGTSLVVAWGLSLILTRLAAPFK